MAELAHAKRLLERWEGDDLFRALLERDPEGAAREYGLEADAVALRPVWDEGWDQTLPVLPVVERYRAFVREKLAHRDELRTTSAPLASNFHHWRLRQMVRTTSQLGPVKAHGIVHPLAAFELSKGCSVGCWFCGISAPKLGDLFPYTDANRGLWREVCTVWREEVGPAAAQGFLYWATDPMDNPDYEKFCCDFHELCGYFPQTTTALPLRDVERTKRLLRLSEERGCLLNRFSLLTLKILDKVHAEFTAEELAFVELVLQIRKEALSKAVAGRALEKARKTVEGDYETSTIACVSGFLVNMVERSVKLISPCPASERWPLGYRVHGEGTFRDGESFRQLLRSLTSSEVMPPTVPRDRPLALRPDLSWEFVDGSLVVSSRYLRQHFQGLSQRMAEMLAAGTFSAADIALGSGVDLPTAFMLLNRMLALGVLDEDPAGLPVGV